MQFLVCQLFHKLSHHKVDYLGIFKTIGLGKKQLEIQIINLKKKNNDNGAIALEALYLVQGMNHKLHMNLHSNQKSNLVAILDYISNYI